jgi:hypothetical protein
MGLRFFRCFRKFRSAQLTNNILEITWERKRDDIANEIRQLGDEFRKKLRDAWVSYLAARAGGEGQSSSRLSDH